MIGDATGTDVAAGTRETPRLDDVREIDLRRVDPDLFGDDATDVEQIGNELVLRVGVALDHLERVLPFLLRKDAPAEEPEPAEDRVERRPELVRDHRHELVLGVGRSLDPRALLLRQLVEPRVVDRHRGAAGELHREHEVVFLVAASRLAEGEGEGAEHVPLDAERDDEPRARADLAEEGEVLRATLLPSR
jgi:hypothetical protein